MGREVLFLKECDVEHSPMNIFFSFLLSHGSTLSTDHVLLAWQTEETEVILVDG